MQIFYLVRSKNVPIFFTRLAYANLVILQDCRGLQTLQYFLQTWETHNLCSNSEITLLTCKACALQQNIDYEARTFFVYRRKPKKSHFLILWAVFEFLNLTLTLTLKKVQNKLFQKWKLKLRNFSAKYVWKIIIYISFQIIFEEKIYILLCIFKSNWCFSEFALVNSRAKYSNFRLLSKKIQP